MKRVTIKNLLLGLPMLLLFSCSTGLKVSSDYDRSADFSSYKTFSLFYLTTNKNVNELNAQRIWNSIREEMTKKGYVENDNNPDLLVKSYGGAGEVEGGYAAADPGYTATGGDPMPGTTMWGGSLSATAVPQTMHGAITVDLVDAKRKHLVWRATAKGKMDYNKRSKLLEQANKAVSEMFKKYPPSKE